MESEHTQARVTIRDAFPNLSEELLKEAEENLRRYVAVSLKIHQSTGRTQEILDRPRTSFNMEERSNPSLKI